MQDLERIQSILHSQKAPREGEESEEGSHKPWKLRVTREYLYK